MTMMRRSEDILAAAAVKWGRLQLLRGDDAVALACALKDEGATILGFDGFLAREDGYQIDGCLSADLDLLDLGISSRADFSKGFFYAWRYREDVFFELTWE